MLKLLLVVLAVRNVVAAFLLDLIASQLVLNVGEIVWVGKRLLTAIRVETIVDWWCVHVGKEWALAHTRAIWRTPRVELEVLELGAGIAHLAVGIAICRGVGAIPVCGYIGPGNGLWISAAFAGDLRICSGMCVV